jgi:N-acetylglucosamine kinase-like BadF-type ATPase
MKYFIGVDGGATKSSAGVAVADGKIISQKSGPALNYHTLGKNLCERNLRSLLRPLFKKYKRIKRVVIGFAGLDTKKDLQIYKRIVKKVVPAGVKFSLFNDAEIALADFCPKRAAGILVISGTGSSVYGEFGSRKAKAVGWDFLLGDEGSAYWLGLSALRKTIRSWDGRGKKTILGKLVLKKAGKKDIPSLMPEIYKHWHERPQEFKKYIASFAMLFHRPSLQKDPVAKEIIETAAQELALGVKAVIKRLGIKKELLYVGFIGSAFKNPRLSPLLVAKIKKIHPQTHFVYNVNPIKGAINLAIKHD